MRHLCGCFPEKWGCYLLSLLHCSPSSGLGGIRAGRSSPSFQIVSPSHCFSFSWARALLPFFPAPAPTPRDLLPPLRPPHPLPRFSRRRVQLREHSNPSALNWLCLREPCPTPPSANRNSCSYSRAVQSQVSCEPRVPRPCCSRPRLRGRSRRGLGILRAAPSRVGLSRLRPEVRATAPLCSCGANRGRSHPAGSEGASDSARAGAAWVPELSGRQTGTRSPPGRASQSGPCRARAVAEVASASRGLTCAGHGAPGAEACASPGRLPPQPAGRRRGRSPGLQRLVRPSQSVSPVRRAPRLGMLLPARELPSTPAPAAGAAPRCLHASGARVPRG